MNAPIPKAECGIGAGAGSSEATNIMLAGGEQYVRPRHLAGIGADLGPGHVADCHAALNVSPELLRPGEQGGIELASGDAERRTRQARSSLAVGTEQSQMAHAGASQMVDPKPVERVGQGGGIERSRPFDIAVHLNPS